MTGTIDHLVLATPNLDETIASLAEQTGVRAVHGGSHPGFGTRNALIALSDSSYLEIVGPDPAQVYLNRPRWFGVDSLMSPRLVTWAAKSDDVPQLAANARARGVTLGEVAESSRRTPGSATLRWTFTNPDAMVEGGSLPFFIDWGSGPHPSSTSPRGLTLLSLAAEHPDVSRLTRSLRAVGISMDVAAAAQPRLVATLSTPRGEIELR
ncbi:MAG: VOC family protein [Gemmatimonadaceae bacterium]